MDAEVLAKAKQLFAQGDLTGSDALFSRLKNSPEFSSTHYPGTASFYSSAETSSLHVSTSEAALQRREANADAHYGIGIIREAKW